MQPAFGDERCNLQTVVASKAGVSARWQQAVAGGISGRLLTGKQIAVCGENIAEADLLSDRNSLFQLYILIQ